MKKILAGLVIVTLIAAVFPVVSGWDHYSSPGTYVDGQPYEDPYEFPEVHTEVTITSGGDPPGGDDDDDVFDVNPWKWAQVKCKWELAEHTAEPGVLVDDDLTKKPTQVAPEPAGNVKVHYFAVVKEGIGTITQVYADVYHPDGQFKYEVPLEKVETVEEALIYWDMIQDNTDIIFYNTIWNDTDGDGIHDYEYTFTWSDVNEELHQYTDCYLYHGCGELSYCQPAGWYTVGVTAADSQMGWGDYWTLWNWFWYIPVTAVNKDFTHVNYGDTISFKWSWANGDRDMATDGRPTIRNIGNVPVEMYVSQDDMNFGYGNVEYDARVGEYGPDNGPDLPEAYLYPPDPLYGTPSATFHYFGILPLCTKDKVDFSIHVTKAWIEDDNYIGNMTLMAKRWSNPPYNVMYDYFIGDEEPGMPHPHNYGLDFNPPMLGPTPPANVPFNQYPENPWPFPWPPAEPGTPTEEYLDP